MIEIIQGTTAVVTCQSNRDNQGIEVFVVACNLDNDPSQHMTSLCKANVECVSLCLHSVTRAILVLYIHQSMFNASNHVYIRS